ncbi:MAG: hypothetical protein HY815_31980 [Candidatus Riflebacteria bacterium]|nr:hypothetical protein [Candidatus Riflebacteria bacterium]
MRIIVIIALVSSLLGLGTLVSGTADAGVPRLDSREYKMLLRPDPFEHPRRGARELWALVKEVAGNEGVKVTDDPGGLEDPKTRYLLFLDTRPFDLFTRGFVLRRRQDEKFKDDREVTFELTLKFRSADPGQAFDQAVSPDPSCGGKTKFEEDVIAQAGSLRSVFSHSGTVELEEPWMNTLEDYARIFPPLASLSLGPQARLDRVNDVTVEERVFSPGVLDFGKGPVAGVSIAVWFKNKQDHPLLAELSYKCKFATAAEAQVEAPRRFLTALQKKLKDRILAGQTKTGMVYKQNSPIHD